MQSAVTDTPSRPTTRSVGRDWVGGRGLPQLRVHGRGGCPDVAQDDEKLLLRESLVECLQLSDHRDQVAEYLLRIRLANDTGLNNLPLDWYASAAVASARQGQCIKAPSDAAASKAATVWAMTSSTSASVMTRGGAKRMVLTWVSLARTPASSSR